MAAAFLLASGQGVDLAANRANASVVALVAQGYLTDGLRPTEKGSILIHLLDGVAKDFDRAVARIK